MCWYSSEIQTTASVSLPDGCLTAIKEEQSIRAMVRDGSTIAHEERMGCIILGSKEKKGAGRILSHLLSRRMLARRFSRPYLPVSEEINMSTPSLLQRPVCRCLCASGAVANKTLDLFHSNHSPISSFSNLLFFLSHSSSCHVIKSVSQLQRHRCELSPYSITKYSV